MAKKVTRTIPLSEHTKQFVNCFEKLRYNHNAFSVYSDFLAISAISISNAVNPNKDRENEYNRIIKSYTESEVPLFAEMLYCIANEMQPAEGTTPQYYDVLGELFGGLQLHDSWKGQFFTPQNVSTMMALMLAGEAEKVIQERGYISTLEPCIGGGANIIGLVNAMFQQGFNPCKQLLVTAYDLDIRCVHMSYIQLSLMGIPAMIQQRNTLTNQTYGDYWYTPIFVLDGWDYRIQLENFIAALRNFPAKQPEPEIQQKPKPQQQTLF